MIEIKKKSKIKASSVQMAESYKKYKKCSKMARQIISQIVSTK